MGFLDWLLGRGDSSEAEGRPSSTPDLVLEDSLDSGIIKGAYRGNQVMFDGKTMSPDGDWTCLYASTSVNSDTPVVLLDTSNQPVHAFSVTRVENAAVANDGTVVVTDVGAAQNQELSGTLTVVDTDGELALEHKFEANIWNCAITDDGQYVSTATHNPDRTVYVFDVGTSDLIAEYETRDLNGPPQEFGSHDGERVLYLFEEDSRYRGINFDGETVWRTDGLELKDKYEQLLKSDDIVDLQEATEVLTEALELNDDEYDRRALQKHLADAYWKLSKQLRKEEGDSDRWLESLTEAKSHYREILSWSQARNGVAKVNRKLSKYYLKEDNEDRALELLREIAALEKEYDDELLTEHNRETIEKLANSEE